MSNDFYKPFTQQEPLSEEVIARVSDILRSGRLHRYNNAANEVPEVSLLEQDYAHYQGVPYCLATTSGGQAIQIALRAAGVKPGTKVLANAYTLAPVPGAIHAVGGLPILIEINKDWHTDLHDLEAKARSSGAKYFLLSHMRGHIANMEPIVTLCDELGITLIEDCAHTMGAKWQGVRSGNFGKAACFSTQTYKHINSGEGGFITTHDPELAARSVITSGSYMLYEKHGAIPAPEVFDKIRLDCPNSSARMDNIRAALIRTQLPSLENNIQRWNNRYQILEEGLQASSALTIIKRSHKEAFVGSSIQFHADGIHSKQIPELMKNCGKRGVEIKWFGADEPAGFTSRYDSWHYLGNMPVLPQTLEVLSTTCDMRIPLTFTEEDCRHIARIIVEEAQALS